MYDGGSLPAKKMRLWSKFISILVLCAGCSEDQSETIYVAASSNVRPAIEELITEFSESSDLSMELVTGSSGKLSAQIMSGAPYDIFISADESYPQFLLENQRLKQEPRMYAAGQLVLWSKQPQEDFSADILLSDEIRSIAIANPSLAPYGKAAYEYIEKSGWADDLEEKLVYGESVSQTNQFIHSNAASLGFTSLSTIMALEEAERGSWVVVDTSNYAPIRQFAALIRTERGKENAELFYKFIFSSQAKSVFRKYGYLVEE